MALHGTRLFKKDWAELLARFLAYLVAIGIGTLIAQLLFKR